MFPFDSLSKRLFHYYLYSKTDQNKTYVTRFLKFIRLLKWIKGHFFNVKNLIQGASKSSNTFYGIIFKRIHYSKIIKTRIFQQFFLYILGMNDINEYSWNIFHCFDLMCDVIYSVIAVHWVH